MSDKNWLEKKWSDKNWPDKNPMWGQPPSAVRPSEARRFAILLFLSSLFALPFAALAQKPSPPIPTADLPAGPMQAKATAACTECHEARIILQQRLSKAAWTKEVDKMIKWGAVVDAADHDPLVDYLSTTFSPDQPPYVPPHSSSATAASTRTK
jgi:hypothetical protein